MALHLAGTSMKSKICKLISKQAGTTITLKMCNKKLPITL